MSQELSEEEVRRKFADVPLGWFCAGTNNAEDFWYLVTRAVRFSTASVADLVQQAGYTPSAADREVVGWKNFAAIGHPVVGDPC